MARPLPLRKPGLWQVVKTEPQVTGIKEMSLLELGHGIAKSEEKWTKVGVKLTENSLPLVAMNFFISYSLRASSYISD